VELKTIYYEPLPHKKLEIGIERLENENLKRKTGGIIK